jgi:hypothetical protein
MSGYTSGNKAPTLMAQAPNRRGNQSKHTATGSGGVTAVTRPQGSTAYAGGHQGAASTGKDATTGRGQKVSVSRPACYDKTPNNSGYMNSDRTNYLK